MTTGIPLSPNFTVQSGPNDTQWNPCVIFTHIDHTKTLARPQYFGRITIVRTFCPGDNTNMYLYFIYFHFHPPPLPLHYVLSKFTALTCRLLSSGCARQRIHDHEWIPRAFLKALCFTVRGEIHREFHKLNDLVSIVIIVLYTRI